jgi:hypothetical protein
MEIKMRYTEMVETIKKNTNMNTPQLTEEETDARWRKFHEDRKSLYLAHKCRSSSSLFGYDPKKARLINEYLAEIRWFPFSSVPDFVNESARRRMADPTPFRQEVDTFLITEMIK